MKLINVEHRPIYQALPENGSVKCKHGITKTNKTLGRAPKVDCVEGLNGTLEYFKEHAK